MSDTIGRITVPAVTVSGTFPMSPEFGYVSSIARPVVVHQFGSANAKIEQRFYTGTAARRWTFTRRALGETARRALRDFWEARKGPDEAFTAAVPNADGTTTATVCRFECAPLSWQHLSDTICSTGVTLVEVVDPDDAPVYAVSETCTRFPSSALGSGLLGQVQEIVPLVKIRVVEDAVPDILLSDRRCTVGGDLYLPRLLRIGDQASEALITQSLDGAADDVRFTFGNADRVMAALSRDTDLRLAAISLSLYHVGSGVKLDLWSGLITDWTVDAGPEFTVTAEDPLYALTVMIPARRATRTCWKPFDDASHGCPFTSAGSLDTGNYPGASAEACDHSYDGSNGCLAHGMRRYFGGLKAEVQGTRIKDNSTGTWGIGRRLINATSIVSDTIQGNALPLIWHSDDGQANLALPVNCLIAEGRSELEYYAALGVIGEGPIGALTTPQMFTQADGSVIALVHSLDGSSHHGFRSDGSGNDLGLRTVMGTDPAGAHEYFALGRVGSTAGAGEEAWQGSVYRASFAAGVGFVEIRRVAPKGSPPTSLEEHAMTVLVSQGLTGWTWSAPGSRSSAAGLTNPVWVAVNTFLRGLGLRDASAAVQEAYFDVEAAIAAAAVAETTVTKLIGSGTAKQWRFKGTLADPKPLRDWLREILNCCLGYAVWSAGKLRVGLRYTASAPHAFTVGNVVMGSLRVSPAKPAFERLVCEFADEEYAFQRNAVEYLDQDHAERFGRVANPMTQTLQLAGCATKDQAGRIATIRTREELGGVTAAEQRAAAEVSLRTTVLALEVELGAVCSSTLDDYPGKFRVTGWRLNRDWSIDLTGRTVTDSCYDLTVGPKPADVPAAPIPVEAARDWNSPPQPQFGVEASPLDSTVALVAGLAFPEGAIDYHTVESGVFRFYYADEAAENPTLTAGINATDEVMSLTSAAGFAEGDYALIDGEIVYCGVPDGADVPIARGHLGSTVDTHALAATVLRLRVRAESVAWPFDFWASAAAAEWQLAVSLPDQLLAAVVGQVRNDYGAAPQTIVCLTDSPDHGLRLAAPAPGATTVTVINVTNADRTLDSADGDQLCSVVATSRACTITLPGEAAMAGKAVTVKRAPGSTYNVVVEPGGTDTIEGGGSAVTLTNAGESRTWTGE